MKSSISSVIKKNIKLKFKKSEKEISVFNKLARKNSYAPSGFNFSSKNLDQNLPVLDHNLDKMTKELEKSLQLREIQAPIQPEEEEKVPEKKIGNRARSVFSRISEQNHGSFSAKI